ncbi:hypothetical protein FRB97_001398, partial [Tulasnella sp. 331]
AGEQDIRRPEQLKLVSYNVANDPQGLSMQRTNFNDPEKFVGDNMADEAHSLAYGAHCRTYIQSGAPPDQSRRRGNAEHRLVDILRNARIDNTNSPRPKFPFSKTFRGLKSLCIGFAHSNDLTSKTTCESRVISIYEPDKPSCGGGYGDLYRGVYLPTGLEIALKRPRTSSGDGRQAEDAKRRFAREGRNWSRLHHENILPFLGSVIISNDTYFLSPWAERGDLAKFLRMRSWFHELSERERLCHIDRDVFERFDEHQIVSGISSGLMYMHANNVIHGDLKAANVLLDSEIHPRLCDFGLTKVLDDELNATSTGMKCAGSWRWMAPELMDSASRSMKSDVYSLGMTIVEVVTGEIPYPNISSQFSLFRAISNGQRPTPDPLSRDGKSFADLWTCASRCWEADPEKRPAAAAIDETINGTQIFAYIIQHLPRFPTIMP